MTTHGPLPAPARTARRFRAEPEDHSVRSAVAVLAAGIVLVALLVGGGAVVATLVDLSSWVGGA